MVGVAVLVAAVLAAQTVPQASGVSADCLRALGPADAGSIPRAERFERVACPDGKLENPYHYDAAGGIARLSRPLGEGEIVRASPEFGLTMVRPGDALELVSAAGSVRIERDVEALQAARPGQHLFVRARDGQVLSVRYEDVAP